VVSARRPNFRLSEPSDTNDGTFAVTVSDEDCCSVVHARGELDLAGRDEFVRACVEGGRAAVVVDMAQLTFLDCSGYGALIAVRLCMQERGGTVTLVHRTGQPARLLRLLHDTDWPSR
jgi:anti-anti-sigma factor